MAMVSQECDAERDAGAHLNDTDLVANVEFKMRICRRHYSCSYKQRVNHRGDLEFEMVSSWNYPEDVAGYRFNISRGCRSIPR
jgi:hypothetical protein